MLFCQISQKGNGGQAKPKQIQNFNNQNPKLFKKGARLLFNNSFLKSKKLALPQIMTISHNNLRGKALKLSPFFFSFNQPPPFFFFFLSLSPGNSSGVCYCYCLLPFYYSPREEVKDFSSFYSINGHFPSPF